MLVNRISVMVVGNVGNKLSSTTICSSDMLFRDFGTSTLIGRFTHRLPLYLRVAFILRLRMLCNVKSK